MLRDGVRGLARQAGVRVGRGHVDDDTAADVPRAVAARPGLGLLLEHGGGLGAHTNQVAAGVDVHYTVKIVHVGLCDGGMHPVVNLRKRLVATRVRLLKWGVGRYDLLQQH